jgi:hypothetical protein
MSVYANIRGCLFFRTNEETFADTAIIFVF